MGASKKLNVSNDAGDLQSEVASFAATLGFTISGIPYSGFNDSDFRKKDTLKPHSKSLKIPPAKNPMKEEKVKELGNRDKKINSSHKSKAPPVAKNVLNCSNLFREDDKRFKDLPKLPLVKPSTLGVWYDDAAELENKVLREKKKAEFNSVEEWNICVEKKRTLGERLLLQYTRDYESSRGKSGDIRMLLATQKSGTAADKVSALSVMIGDNAIANLRSIDAILGMVTSKIGKRHALTGFEVLKELFLTLLPDRKLKTLFQQPLNYLPDTKDGNSLLLFWYWEECLKEKYISFVSALEEASQDVLDKLKNLALKTMYSLLSSKSEQERRILSSLVNKLGDPENKVASNADYHLGNLLADHPNMKAVVIDEVDNFLFRPHLGLRAKYHAVNFLSQTRLSHKGDGPKVAKRLTDIYFALFKVLISEASPAPSAVKHAKENKNSTSSKKNKSAASEKHFETDSRLLSALLTGINRAFPFVSSDETDEVIEVQTPLLFQLVHSENFNVGVQALLLLEKISSKNQIASDRYYRALYSKLILPSAMNSSKEEMFVGLLLRSMKNDINIKRVAAFSKRLLQVAIQLPPQYACGFLFLISEVLKACPPLWNFVLQNGTEVADEDVEHFVDILEDDANVTNSGPDKNVDQDSVTHTRTESGNDTDTSLDEDGSASSDSEDDGLDESVDLFGEGGLNTLKELKSTPDRGAINARCSNDHMTSNKVYFPQHREPSYCNADHVGWWELVVLASHVHPSVAAMARTLLSGVYIVYNGNPLVDLSLVAFLDKFMEKKPRQSTWHGASQIEPAKKLDMNHQLIGADILSLDEADVPPEDIVFHKFYMNKMNSSKKPKKKKKKTAEDEAAEEILGDDDGDEDGDESDNEEIKNMLDSGRTNLEMDGDYDYDDLDKIANDDDRDLIGGGSDDDITVSSEIAGNVIEDDDIDSQDGSMDIAIGEAEDDSDFDKSFDQRKKKRKARQNPGVSPFASLEDYEHLMNDDKNSTSTLSTQKKRRKSKKKSHS